MESAGGELTVISLFNRIGAKAQQAFSMLLVVGSVLVLSIWGHSTATGGAAHLPAGSAARVRLEFVASVTLWLPLVGIPVALVLLLTAAKYATSGLRNAGDLMAKAAEGDLSNRMVG